MSNNQNELQILNFNSNQNNQGNNVQEKNTQGMNNQGMMQQGMMQPTMYNQGMMQQGMMQPGMMQPGMMPGMMPMMIPGMQLGINLPNIGYTTDSLQILENAPVAKIRQQIEWLELITCCETKNRYDVFAKINEQSIFLFRCKEQSGWCMRNCCPGNCREFSLKLTLPNQQIFAYLERPFKCTCYCCNRPLMTGKFKDGRKFGKIIEPFRCCSPLFETFDESDSSKYFLEIPCCQCGFCCRGCICGKCSEVYGNIYNNSNLTTPVGVIKKKEKCIQETFTDANTFVITFPVDATIYDKLNLIAAVLMIDYRYYEENSCSENI
jgi:hypothetical protein